MITKEIQFNLPSSFTPNEIQQEMLDFINETLRRRKHVFVMGDRRLGLTRLFKEMIDELAEIADDDIEILYVTPNYDMMYGTKNSFQPFFGEVPDKEWRAERQFIIKRKKVRVTFTTHQTFILDYKSKQWSKMDMVFQDCMFPTYVDGMPFGQIVITGNTIENGNGMKVWVGRNV